MNQKLKIITSIAVIASILGVTLTANVKAMDSMDTTMTTTTESVVTSTSTPTPISEKHSYQRKGERPTEPPQSQNCEDGDTCPTTAKPKMSFEQAQSIALKRINNIIERIENIKKRTEEKALADNVKEVIISELDKDLDYLNQMKTRIENATTAEELLQIRKELRDHADGRREEIMQKARAQIASNILARMENAINISNTVISKLESIVSELKEQGIDTSKAEEYLSKAQSYLKQATSLYETAKTQTEDAEAFKATTKAFYEVIHNVRENIKSAGESIKEVAPTPTTN